MNKKLIMSKTILFVAIIGFIIIFKSIFGNENTLIGVTTITAMLMFLERDLTLAPWKNTFTLIALNLFIGCASTLASMNTWLGIPINFIAIFILGYSLLYNLKKPMYMPFVLEYLFILATPVSIELIPNRLSALVCGAIFIMVSQLVINKNKFKKVGNQLLAQLCKNIIKKAEYIKVNQQYEGIDKDIREQIHLFTTLLYDRREEDFYLTEEGMIKLNLAVSLEKISYLLDKVKYEAEQQEMIDDLISILDQISKCFNDLAEIDCLDEIFKTLLSKYQIERINDIEVLKLLNHLSFIKNNLEELSKIENNQYNLERFKKHFVFKIELDRNSIKFSYACRLAIGITLAAFLTDFFKLTEGRWIMFTVFSLIVPIYEQSKQKLKDRIFATIIGSIIVVILFSIFHDLTIRTIILMGAGYIGNYLKQYRHTTICVTVSAIGAAALMGDALVLSESRILFVIFGAIIALVINRFILPYRLETHNKQLEKLYRITIEDMMNTVYEMTRGNGNEHKLKNLFILTSLIEDRIKLNNQLAVNIENQDMVKDYRLFLITIYELYIWATHHEISVNVQHVLVDIGNLLKGNQAELIPAIEEGQRQIQLAEDIYDKVILSIIVEILQEEESIKNKE
ncbi:FUSC family protein [Niameybacter massiliensis]|uniref:FUSC family protein n=1 Tax=Holtiella tumoricola TaxID=3018743 RepID=A0AA42DPV9_9FIRM|nr:MULTISPECIES: FUSC family protein [Lachnospirales]MDA3732968.1 FUSC family protein [Holtiella tumoricola]